MTITGSASKNSHTASLAQAIHQQLQKDHKEISIIHYDLVQRPLPLFTVDERVSTIQNNKNLQEFLQSAEQADGFIRGSPVYHGSFSGLLKNALDWVDFFLNDKVVGLISNGANRGRQVVDALSLVAKNKHATVVTSHVCTHKTDFDAQGQIIADDVHQRIQVFSQQYASYLEKFSG